MNLQANKGGHHSPHLKYLIAQASNLPNPFVFWNQEADSPGKPWKIPPTNFSAPLEGVGQTEKFIKLKISGTPKLCWADQVKIEFGDHLGGQKAQKTDELFLPILGKTVGHKGL